MDLYLQNYVKVLKSNFMLLIMVLLLIVLTFFIWAGFPIFIVGGFIAKFTANLVISHLCIALSGGFIFSLFFAPINFKAAKNVAVIKQLNVRKVFLRIQTTWILVSSIIFEIGMGTILILHQ